MKEYTYTRTFTDQEEAVYRLKQAIYAKIKNAIFNGSNDTYLRVSSNGELSNEPAKNIYDEGMLVCDDYTVKKLKGLGETGDAYGMSFEYQDSMGGSIVSYGEDFSTTRVKIGDLDVPLLEWANHPEILDYVNQVADKIENVQQFGEVTPGSRS